VKKARKVASFPSAGNTGAFPRGGVKTRRQGAGHHSPEWLLPGVGADVLPQVAERGEVLGAAVRITVERLARVEPLVGLQPAEPAQVH